MAAQWGYRGYGYRGLGYGLAGAVGGGAIARGLRSAFASSENGSPTAAILRPTNSTGDAKATFIPGPPAGPRTASARTPHR
ncbi:hypothetical protein DCG74_16005 [Bradyrhizobium sp. WBAH42]|nr:hypothetical protein [Bradyrhizobium sp. WBAH30]MDD1540442.1 hypothetical protein [Bradyrhizobium sp. WBAH41]MDD1556113.1 hypothetical protein [Bradyrhizobium sp. WBAH23]MDD1563076.1 hypothetical protein [Bradyrhizobium sp. WBAH33]MDD1588421.1 hypothetical protein [Bradyrhizobium sp. WBAH42]NRB86135.1 hypothetical protein [Bradyrhizobium sp. WBAH10]QCJ89903.1 hypothetical protein DAA57_16445 [Bradyrhizobium yuanmingense]